MIKTFLLAGIISMVASTDVLTFVGVFATAALALFGVVYTQRTTRKLQEVQIKAQYEQQEKERAAESKSAQVEAEKQAFERARETYEAMLSNTAAETARLARRATNRANRVSQLEKYIRSIGGDVPLEEDEDE